MTENTNKYYQQIAQNARNGRKALAVLIDPDKQTGEQLIKRLSILNTQPIDYILVGGSLLYTNRFEETVNIIKEHTNKPCLIFPGSFEQISKNADALLLLSLISGRNPEYLISNHVLAAPKIKAANIEVISTAYLLIESGCATTASYISNTLPIPSTKPEIAAITALAGSYIGMKLVYLDGGSGAEFPVPQSVIKQVKTTVNLPLFVGGGIRTAQQITNAFNAGADVVIIGNAIEENPYLLENFSTLHKSDNA